MSTAMELMPTVGLALDKIMISYQMFISADKKRDKIVRLREIQMAAIDIYRGTKQLIALLDGKLIASAPRIAHELAAAIRSVTGENIHQQILNLNHLALSFMAGEEPEGQEAKQKWISDKLQILYEMNNLSNDIAETAVITSAEPDKGTNRA